MNIIADLTDVSSSFPHDIERDAFIDRSNLIDAIDTILGGITEIAAIEGSVGVGRTTILAGFVRRHAKKAISLFIRPVSRLAYDPTIVHLDLCAQLEWALE